MRSRARRKSHGGPERSGTPRSAGPHPPRKDRSIEIPMKIVRAILKDGLLAPTDPIEIPDGAAVTIAVLAIDDLSADALGRLASRDTAFDFLSDPREDIYSANDGERV